MQSKIEWLRDPLTGKKGYSLNPIKGLCPMDCKDLAGKPYCYARRMYRRFKWNPEIRFEYADTLRALYSIKKASRIFVGSTMELFGKWIAPAWQHKMFREIPLKFPQHTIIFLTKQPQNLPQWSPFPENCWVGISCDTKERMAEGYSHLANVKAKVKFISFEPLLERMNVYDLSSIDWVIIGSRTQPTRHPRKEWVEEIIGAADRAGIPVFVKSPLAEYMGIERKEYPK